MKFRKIETAFLAPMAAGVLAILSPAPVHAAEGGAVLGVQFAFDGACTAASPTTFGTTVRYTGETEDANGEDYIQIYHLDGNNTVVSRHSGSGVTHGATIGQTLTSNAFTRIVATPATGPYTAVLWDSTGTDFDFNGGDTMDLNSPQVMATLVFDMNALDPDCPGVADSTPPTVASVVRGSPTTEDTDSDSLTWRVTFSETVQNVDAADFAASGTTGTISNVSAQSGAAYDVTVSGGDLAGLVNTVVSLGFAGGQNIQDAAGNALVNTTPGTNESYTVDNTPDTTPPTLDRFIRFSGSSRTNGNSVVFGANFSEPVVNVSAGDFTVNGGAGSVSGVTGSGTGTYQITVDGLAGFNGVIGLDLAASADIEDAAGNRVIIAEPPTDMTFTIDSAGPIPTVSALGSATLAQSFTAEINFDELVSDFDISDIVAVNATLSNFSGSRDRYFVSVNPTGGDLTLDIPAGAAHDALGNASSAATTFTILADAIPPTITQATRITANANAGVTNSDTLEASLTFSEPVQNISSDDFTVTGATGASVAVSATSGTSVNLTVSGGDIANFNGSVEIQLSAGQDIADAAGNPLPANSLANLGWTVDNLPPTPTILTQATDPVSGAFDILIAFDDGINGGPNVLTANEVIVGNGTLSNFQPQAGNSYTATITPTAEGPVTIDVPAGVAADQAGNLNLASETFTIAADLSAPTVTLTPEAAEVEGAFTLTVSFSEDVTGFALDDLVLVNGDASDLVTISASEYTVMITPQTFGAIEISLPAGAVQDLAGNDSEAGSASAEAVTTALDVSIAITGDITDPTTLSGTATIVNPGSQAVGFTAAANVPWLEVTPAEGVIPASGSIAFTIRITEAVEALDPGNYTGTITIRRQALAGQAGGADKAEVNAIIVEIPVAVSLAPRRGTIQIVSTTPSGISGEASFGLSSDIAGLDGVTLTTAGGRASSAQIELLRGSYSVQQGLPQGWRVNAITCSGDADNGSVVDLASGAVAIDLDPQEAIVCTFENIRDADEVRIATQRAIRNFMIRRADRLLDASPDIAARMRERETSTPGAFSATVEPGSMQFALSASLSGLRNHAKANANQMPGAERFAADPEHRLDVWFASEFSSLSDDRAGEAASSSFGVLQFGADWLVSDQLLVGVLVQRDWMDERAETINLRAGAVAGAEIDGTGWMAGPYAVWSFGGGLTADLLALHGTSSNTVNPLGLYEDHFDTTRTLLRAGLSGEITHEAWRIRPRAQIAHFEETQDAYLDSLAITIPDQTIVIGRLSAGPEIAYRFDRGYDGHVELISTITAVWDYDGAGLMDANGVIGSTSDDLRADARFGLRSTFANGSQLEIEVGTAGLGVGKFEANTVRFQFRMPL